MKKIIFILFIILSIKAECGVIIGCSEKSRYKLTEDNRFLVEIDKKIIKIYDHLNEKFLFEISDIKDEIIFLN